MSYIPETDLVIKSIRAALESETVVCAKITSNSMSPLIKNGDFVSIMSKNVASMAVGDIIVLECDGELLTHRLINRGVDTLITRGDRNPISDPDSLPEQAVGLVVSRKRQNGSSIDLLKGHGYFVSRTLFHLSQMEHLWANNQFFRNFVPNFSVLFRGLARLIAYLV